MWNRKKLAVMMKSKAEEIESRETSFQEIRLDKALRARDVPPCQQHVKKLSFYASEMNLTAGQSVHCTLSESDVPVLFMGTYTCESH
jgi:hypothetical protein